MKGHSLDWEFSGLESGCRVSDKNFVGIEVRIFPGSLGRGKNIGPGSGGGWEVLPSFCLVFDYLHSAKEAQIVNGSQDSSFLF
jgi:hypothetical protein